MFGCFSKTKAKAEYKPTVMQFGSFCVYIRAKL